MSNQVPFTAFCPECNGHRTFTLRPRFDVGIGRYVGCCVCGTGERKALVSLSERLTDDRDTLGEIAARINTLDGELAELRDEVHEHLAPSDAQLAFIAKLCQEQGWTRPEAVHSKTEASEIIDRMRASTYRHEDYAVTPPWTADEVYFEDDDEDYAVTPPWTADDEDVPF